LTGKAAASILFLILAACCTPSACAAPAISINDFRAEPAYLEVDAQGLPVQIILGLNLSNAGNVSGTVNVTISRGDRILFSRNVTVESRSELGVNFTWSVGEPGKYNLTAAILGDATVPPDTKATVVSISYVPVKTPSPWYAIPCAFLVIIITVVAIFLGIRWLGGGGSAERENDD